MKTYGLLGFPLSHSFSHQYFRKKFDIEQIKEAEYLQFEMDTIENIRKDFATFPNLIGFNVTIPYKQKIIPFLDELDAIAAKIGAVNTVKIVDGKWIGYNTDVIGFEIALVQFLKKNNNNPTLNALVLGDGGASKAVYYVLQKLGIPYLKVTRKQQTDSFTFETITHDLLQSTHLIINTTPLGTFPNILEAPILPYSSLTAKHLLFDLVYNPPVTTFMQKGLDAGCKVENGYIMLVKQAEAAWRIWEGVID